MSDEGKILTKENIKISVVIPCYNEADTLENVIERVRGCGLETEIIVVDDGSTDGSRELMKGELYDKIDKILFHKKNQGKGAALRHGFAAATGDLVVVQDADLEYDPKEFNRLSEPFLDGGDADVVYGSRYLKGNRYRVDGFYHELGNKMLTAASNIFSDLSLTDMETCYKMFKREIIQNIKIEENRFGFEPEVTAKLAKMRCRIYEIPIAYHPRTFEEGKKIGWKDAVRALYCIIKYNLVK
ncbi:MAG: glycosyltransferase family 2 protein [Lachnospiraceae bacterium]|nr:glycosyltransferase family 2 protein [Lachnospiraceae bacterium]